MANQIFTISRRRIDLGVVMIPVVSGDHGSLSNGEHKTSNLRKLIRVLQKTEKVLEAASFGEGKVIVHVLGISRDIELLQQKIPSSVGDNIFCHPLENEVQNTNLFCKSVNKQPGAHVIRQSIPFLGNRAVDFVFVATHESNGKKKIYSNAFEKQGLQVLKVPCRKESLDDVIRRRREQNGHRVRSIDTFLKTTKSAVMSAFTLGR